VKPVASAMVFTDAGYCAELKKKLSLELMSKPGAPQVHFLM
jgi:hypothetical protein